MLLLPCPRLPSLLLAAARLELRVVCIGLVPHASIVKPQLQLRLLFVHVGSFCKGGIHFGSIWLKDSEGLSGSNKQILAEATAAIGKICQAEGSLGARG